MSLLSCAIRHLSPSPKISHQQIRRIADHRPFAAGDLVLLRQTHDRSANAILTRPLQSGKRIENHKGILQHDDIIGKRVRDIVKTAPSKSTGREGTEYRVHEVKLEDYARLSKRLVTPVYPADANLIVSLLDLHPEAPYPAAGVEEEQHETLEILEAGTGHGALTLYLSRAVHLANPPLDRCDGETLLEDWRASRRAVIHSVDVSARYSTYAQTIVEGFRRGLYAPHVDFHVGDVGEWTANALARHGGKPFLSHALLDLPNAEAHLDVVASALRVDGTLIVFNPSVTQITQAAIEIRENDIALELERVVELGVNGGTGGREWDIRAVRPRAAAQKAPARPVVADDAGNEGGTEGESDDSGIDTSRDEDQQVEVETAADSPPSSAEKQGWAMVCRPKVGDRIVGGGFLGVWKKQRQRAPQ